MIENKILISLDPPRISVIGDAEKEPGSYLLRELSDKELRSLLVEAGFVDQKDVKNLREFLVFIPIQNSALLPLLRDSGIICTRDSADCNCEDGMPNTFEACTNMEESRLCACAEGELFCA